MFTEEELEQYPIDVYVNEGTRGPYMRINGKMFFPDRSWKNCYPNDWARVKKTKEFDNYGFVTGIYENYSSDITMDQILDYCWDHITDIGSNTKIDEVDSKIHGHYYRTISRHAPCYFTVMDGAVTTVALYGVSDVSGQIVRSDRIDELLLERAFPYYREQVGNGSIRDAIIADFSTDAKYRYAQFSGCYWSTVIEPTGISSTMNDAIHDEIIVPRSISVFPQLWYPEVNRGEVYKLCCYGSDELQQLIDEVNQITEATNTHIRNKCQAGKLRSVHA